MLFAVIFCLSIIINPVAYGSNQKSENKESISRKSVDSDKDPLEGKAFSGTVRIKSSNKESSDSLCKNASPSLRSAASREDASLKSPCQKSKGNSPQKSSVSPSSRSGSSREGGGYKSATSKSVGSSPERSDFKSPSSGSAISFPNSPASSSDGGNSRSPFRPKSIPPPEGKSSSSRSAISCPNSPASFRDGANSESPSLPKSNPSPKDKSSRSVVSCPNSPASFRDGANSESPSLPKSNPCPKDKSSRSAVSCPNSPAPSHDRANSKSPSRPKLNSSPLEDCAESTKLIPSQKSTSSKSTSPSRSSLKGAGQASSSNDRQKLPGKSLSNANTSPREVRNSDKSKKASKETVFLNDDIRNYKKPPPFVPAEFRRRKEPINWVVALNSKNAEQMRSKAKLISESEFAAYKYPPNYPIFDPSKFTYEIFKASVDDAKTSKNVEKVAVPSANVSSVSSFFEKSKSFTLVESYVTSKLSTFWNDLTEASAVDQSKNSGKSENSSRTSASNDLKKSALDILKPVADKRSNLKSTNELPSRSKQIFTNFLPNERASLPLSFHPKNVTSQYTIEEDIPSFEKSSKSPKSAMILFSQWVEKLELSGKTDQLLPFSKNNVILLNPDACCLQMAKIVYNPPFSYKATLQQEDYVSIYKDTWLKPFLIANTPSVECYIWDYEGPDPRDKSILRLIEETVFAADNFGETTGILIPGPKRNTFFTLRYDVVMKDQPDIILPVIYSYHVVDFDAHTKVLPMRPKFA